MLSRILILMRRHPWAIPIMAGLGALTSLLEGVTISLLAPFFATLSQASAPIGSRYLEWLNRGLAHWPLQQRIPVIGAAILVGVLCKNLVGYGRDRFTSRLAGEVVHGLRVQVHRQVLTLAIGSVEGQTPGALGNLVGAEIYRVMACYTGVSGLLSCAAYITIFLMLLTLLSWQLTLAVILSVGLLSGALRQLNLKAKQSGRLLSQVQGNLNNRFHESVQAAREVRIFGQEERESQRFAEESWCNTQTQWGMDRLTALVGPLFEVTSMGLFCVILFVVVPLVSTSYSAELPKIIAFSILLYRLQPQIRSFETNRMSVSGNLPAVDHVSTFIDSTNKPYVTGGPRPFEKLTAGIELRDVSFRYPNALQPALTGVSAAFPVGRTTALVGPSGAGKSTLAALLIRFYDPDSGAVSVDGVPLPELDLKAWRAQLGVVSQHVFLFDDTVARNIAYGRPDAPTEAIERAARLAHAHEFIEALPRGYDTKLGDRGMQLSGGQRQRVALARALLMEPCIFILDEATSSLDNLAEHLVQEALDTLSHSHTIIVIAHRLSTVEKADNVIVLQDGRVVEQGTPQELRQSRGTFARLYAAKRG